MVHCGEALLDGGGDGTQHEDEREVHPAEQRPGARGDVAHAQCSVQCTVFSTVYMVQCTVFSTVFSTVYSVREYVCSEIE